MNGSRTWVIGILVSVIATLAVSSPARSVSIHECIGADGVVRFQDKPCLPGEPSRKRDLPDDPVAVGLAEPAESVRPAPQAAVNPVSAMPPASLQPPSSAFLCQREDGTRYLSANGVGNRRAVPLGTLGYPPMTLGEAYAGSNGIGISAPGLRDVPVVPPRQGRGAGLYTWVEDPCSRVSGAALCAFYADQLEDAQRRLRFAFSDTTEQVRAEVSDWQSRLAGCRR
ncbi:hypothetical protein [Dokdonella sp.]|uniref:hypothetical protein n=1 Tax=Dokdonella sp. TaxID=2291710 RepID=UPI003529B011